jgi:hypothetical protein
MAHQLVDITNAWRVAERLGRIVKASVIPMWGLDQMFDLGPDHVLFHICPERHEEAETLQILMQAEIPYQLRAHPTKTLSGLILVRPADILKLIS